MNSDGLRWLWEPRLDDLRGAGIRVSDGTESAEAAVESVELSQESPDGSQGISAVLKARFAGDQGAFEWRKREVVVSGVVIDSVSEDMGRKVLGAEWEVVYELHLLEA